MQYNFNFNNRCAVEGISCALSSLISVGRAPVIVCIGSDRISGDSLGPITGSMLKKKLFLPQIFILGNLEKTVTAKEVNYLNHFLRETFPHRLILCVDSAVGSFSDVGAIKISDAPISPGSGINKKLAKVGDVSIQGVVAEKGLLNAASLSEVRMNMVYKMSDIISDSIASFLLGGNLTL